MQVEFRQLGPEEPAPGELWVRPRAGASAPRRDLARVALERGPGAFQAGAGTPQCLLVPANPTLDDMLAATFLEASLRGAPWPAAADALARYAALQREGLQPGDVPLTASIEGIFLAQRNAHGDDLTAPGVGERFLEDWRRTAARLHDAVGRGLDPFRTPLFSGPEFARECAFLGKDQEVYHQDVLRGERWIVRLPGGPPRASGLLLREPKALLAKQWARRDAGAPVGGTYLLLVVRWGPGQWVISTDPVQRLSLEPLARALQAAEQRQDARRAASDPWFDGRPFAHTLVAAPRPGTILKDEVVLHAVRGWCGARRAVSPGARRKAIVAGVAAVLVGAAGLFLLLRRDPAEGASVDFRTRGAPLGSAAKAALLAGTPRLRGLALLVAVGKPLGERQAVMGAAGDVARLYLLLRDRYGFLPEDMLVLSDEAEQVAAVAGEPIPVLPDRPDRRGLIRAMETLGDRALLADEDEQLQLVFYYAGHGKPPVVGERSGYLMLAGFGETDEPLDMRGYDMGDLTTHLARKVARCRHQLVLLDCCHSGFAIRSYGDYRREPSQVYDLWRNAAYAVVTAGTEEERVCDGPQSAFNFVLLEALGGGPGGTVLADGFARGRTEVQPEHRDGIVTDAELGVYLESQVMLYCENQKLPLRQSPRYVRGMEQDDVGQFLFVPRAAR